MLLFKVGLLTLINIYSFIFLAKLFREWERLQLRKCDYKNHRIFTLRCIHKELVRVSTRLKTTLRTEKARKIIKTAKKTTTMGKN